MLLSQREKGGHGGRVGGVVNKHWDGQQETDAGRKCKQGDTGVRKGERVKQQSRAGVRKRKQIKYVTRN